ncbi:hypothetical protein MUA90_03460 [Staphylococcus sp. IVB6181]|uniref:hypothetical protein n=1 Tax=Staphylococcus sp. IVB6181 TaxID=2929481 RepID=UPI0021D2FDFA|nr:hypothetical protein [Staphylococcus sp. IVB6181]UXV35589.1 hypothetical protein MUA90_03460 [Staphylococcus sp. IVB6181]
MKLTLVIIVIVLLIINFIPNYIMYRRLKAQGEQANRRALMIGVDAILLVIIVVGLVFMMK